MALQQIANTDISSTGTFALGSISSSTLTSGRVTYATTGGLLTDSSSLTFNGSTLTASSLSGGNITNSSLTSGRITYASTGGLLVDSANLTFSGTTLTANTIGAFTLGGTVAGGGNQINNVIIGSSTPLAGSFTSVNATSITNSGLTSGRVTFAGASGLLTDSANFIWDNTNARLGIGTSPSFKLHISTTGNVTSQAYNVNTDTGAGVYVGYLAATDKNETALRSYGSGFTTFTHAGLALANWTELFAQTASSTGPAGMLIGLESASPLVFATNNTEKMRITSAGNVGIGTSSPADTNNFGRALDIQSSTGAAAYFRDSDDATKYGVAGFFGADSNAYYGSWGTSTGVLFYSSSTERMRLDASGNLGIGITNPTAKLTVKGQTHTAPWFAAERNGSTTLQFKIVGAENTGYTASTGTVSAPWTNVIDNNNSDLMLSTVLSGGTGGNIILDGKVGIGTSSPAANFHISKSTTATVMISNISTSLVTDDAMGLIDFSAGSSNTVNARISGLVVGTSEAGGSLAVETRTDGGSLTEKFRITGAGNVGIGTSSPINSLTATNGVTVSGAYSTLAATSVGTMDYSSGLYRFFSLGANTSTPGGFAWYGYSSNTGAGAERMRIDSSGNLLLGTTITVSKATVYGTGNQFVSVISNAGGATQVGINLNPSMTDAEAAVNPAQAAIYAVDSSYSANIIFANKATGAIGNSLTERMRITSDGRLRFISSSSYNDQQNAKIQWVNENSNGVMAQISCFREATSGAPGALAFYTSPNVDTNQYVPIERMRLNSGGDALFGTPDNTTNGGIILAPGYNGEGISNIIVGHKSTGGNGNQYMIFNYNGVGIGSIAQSGTTAVLYNTTSDQRLKTNIVDAPSGNIDDIKVRSFDWIADGNHQTYGLVAQELLEVAPYAVHQPQKPEEMMAVDYSKLVPMMIKSIQEQQALIESMATKLKDAGVAGF